MLSWNRCERKFAPMIAERRAAPLATTEAAALDRHLEGCASCRAFEADLRELVDGMREASAERLLEHPTAAQFTALDASPERMQRAEREELEGHLARCGDCRAEWNVATNWRPARRSASVAAPRPARWSWFGAGVLATATAVTLFALVLPDDAPEAIGARPALQSAGSAVQLRGAHHRADEEATALPVAAGVGIVLVALTVEAAPGAALELTLLDERGKPLERAGLRLDDPSGLLLFSVAADRLPERSGEFEVRIDGSAQNFRYPFRVERSGG